ncbi:predicted protein [Micromonas commoda]|uniref:threonine--tRNA ligase n=1 Tax=Micromonas commoda (strain RCC299 / NOUM17 / CCMP2709) TaxID=296587 RepID=C1E0A5_MICCC|nr:predicted protein [Micromonas commoda]ACO60782.1 predicted protein [Micromonas commoda]|eukprot:XP_002499524.1 predicted protein [Micromonas commoda]
MADATASGCVGVPSASLAAATAASAAPVKLLTSDESEELLKIRHTTAHICAMAVQRLFPTAQVTIGPWIDRGFYYDFDYPAGFSDKDLKDIKKQMIKIINKDMPLRREEVSREEARKRIEALNEPYKLEILDAIKTEPITIYHIGDEWWDLCAGPHVESTKAIHPKAIDLESVAGAYWRGDEKRPMLQRIYGTAWSTPEELKAYNDFKAEAARRDHRKVGKDLNLFSIQQEDVGGGLVFWHPKGALMRDMIERFWKDIHLERGYDLLYTPHVGKLDLWKTSGHADFYSENMYRPIDVEDETYQLKPMNCPFHVAVYKDGYFSYRDLPIRWAEMGTVYRYERSGTMHGLFRVRGFTQDDAHIFCLPDQIADEIKGVLDLTEDILSTFGFKEFEVNLSTQPEKSVGGPEIWDKAEGALKDALAQKGWDYEVDEGGGAFYGPKIDIKILDAIGRKWQCSTVQLDFNLPERFDLAYIDKENVKQRPIMIHRAIFGSLERFFGILTENYAGAFPLWIAPTQVRLLPVTDAVDDYVQETARKLRAAGIRCDVQSQERLAKLVRNAEKAKIPVMCVVGEQEAKDGTLAVRTYADGDQGVLSVDDVVARISAANQGKGEKF